MSRGQKLTARIGVQIFLGTGRQPGAAPSGDQHVLIDREVVDALVVLLEVVAEPVETVIDLMHGFAKHAAAEFRPAAAEVV